MRPSQLRAAALANDLFLAEDGTVLQIVDEKSGATPVKKRKRRTKEEMRRDAEAAAAEKEKKKKGKKRVKDEDAIDLGVEDDDVPLTSMKKKKPRIKISLKEVVSKGEEGNGGSGEGNAESPKATPGRKKRGRASVADKASEGSAKKVVRRRSMKPKPVAPKSYDAEYLDVGLMKLDREALAGDLSYDASRAFFTKRGPWVLPEPLTRDKFRDVAIATFKKVEKLDRYSVFAEPVSDADAPDYSDIVKNPIDLSTMNSKLESGAYGEGSEAASKLYADYLLMFDNCRLYNEDDGEVTEEAARIMALVPEMYAGACTAVRKKQK